MEDGQELDRADFEAWWENEGSSPPPPLLDTEEQIYHKCREAWLNGAFKAEMRCEARAASEYSKHLQEQEWQ